MSVIIIVFIIVLDKRDRTHKGLEGRETAWRVKEFKETCDQPQSGEVLNSANYQYPLSELVSGFTSPS